MRTSTIAPLVPPPRFNALLVADDPAHAAFVSAQLTSAATGERFGQFAVHAVARTATSAAVERDYDVILFGIAAPGDAALASLRELLASNKDVPVVVSTAAYEMDFAIQALMLGAQDVLCESETGTPVLPRALRYAIARRRTQTALQAALKEKEVLLHELHHRAKNNLQVVSGLLNMQARRDRDPRFREIVATAQQRIDAIALAHDKLHQAPNLSRIDFSAYLGALASAVHLSHGGEARGIALELCLGQCELPLQDAVPTGLVANELLMNAFKHAFPEGRAGVIRLKALRHDAHFTLEVADDGIGIPSGVTNDPRRLGLDIVATLAEQLDARLEHDSEAGTRFRLSFVCSEEG